MKVNFAGFLLTAAVLSAAHAAPLSCEKVVDYRIDVLLDEKAGVLNGNETIVWNNPGSATDELFLHLYLNAFRNNQSTLMREALQRAPKAGAFSSVLNGGWGYCEIVSISAESPELFPRTDLRRDLSFVAPDDGNTEDRTAARLALPRTVPAGAKVILYIDFVSKLPHRAPRTGRHQDFFFAGQWFPKIAVRSGDRWVCHQFHASTEFFSDYGDYEVAVTVPSGYVVGATGVQTEERRTEAGRKTVVFRGECVHDFAWTAWPRFRTAERRFEYPELPSVNMRLLYLPEHEKYVDRFFDGAAATLKHFGLWYLPYPYPQLTIVDTPLGTNVAGMEYPTLFTTGVDWIEASGGLEPLGLTIHECGHQWFYGLLGSNETEHAWLDEGFTVYATARCLDAAFGPARFYRTYLARKNFGIPWTFPQVIKDHRDSTLALHRQRGKLDKMDKPSFLYSEREAYRNNAYEKPSLMLWTLEGLLGDPLFGRIMGEYARRYQFRHPEPQDFIDVVNEFAPQDMNPFFDQVMRGYGVLDYAVVKITADPIAAPKGFFGEGDSLRMVEKEAPKLQLSRVHLERRGTILLPVDLLVTFEDGETVREHWEGVETYKVFSYVRRMPVEKAQLDPDYKLRLDVDPANNGRFRRADAFPAFRWGLKWLLRLQHFLETAAIFS